MYSARVRIGHIPIGRVDVEHRLIAEVYRKLFLRVARDALDVRTSLKSFGGGEVNQVDDIRPGCYWVPLEVRHRFTNLIQKLRECGW